MMEVKIEKLVYGGEGLGRQKEGDGAGRVVLVPLVLPGERVSAEPLREERKLVRARLAEILERSPERVAPECPYFTRCGGCHYQHLGYQDQLRYKAEILSETLRRLGKLDAPQPEILSGEPWGYRNRSQFKALKRGSEFQLGYFERGTQNLVDVEQCPISSPAINALLPVLRELGGRPDFPEGPSEIELFNAEDQHIVTVREAARFPETLAGALRERLPGMVSLAVGDAGRVFGRGHLTYRAAGFDYRVSHGVFFQVNRFLTDSLAGLATRELEGGLALDLFAGGGFFTLPLARRFGRVMAVEVNAAAVRDLESNVALAKLSNVEVVRGGVDEFLARTRNPRPDAILLDPPRAGLGKAAAAALAKMAAPKVVYVSCDPATLARDLARLVASGYRLERLYLVDLFPHTFHIESVAMLTKESEAQEAIRR